jgi:hypothetical protein
MKLSDHVSLNFNNNMSTSAVFLDIEKACDTWHPGLLYKLSVLRFTISLTKLIASFLTNRKFKFSVEGELSSPRKVAAGVPQGYVLAQVLYSLYINDAPAAPGIHNEGETQTICSKRRRMPGDDLQLNGRNIPFVNIVKYRVVIFDRMMT